jgi:hypothetical protein
MALTWLLGLVMHDDGYLMDAFFGGVTHAPVIAGVCAQKELE